MFTHVTIRMPMVLALIVGVLIACAFIYPQATAATASTVSTAVYMPTTSEQAIFNTATSPFAVFGPLNQGDSGDTVVKLKKSLSFLGYLTESEVTKEIFDQDTLNAVITFQCARNIVCDDVSSGSGMVGPRTRAMLNAAVMEHWNQLFGNTDDTTEINALNVVSPKIPKVLPTDTDALLKLISDLRVYISDLSKIVAKKQSCGTLEGKSCTQVTESKRSPSYSCGGVISYEPCRTSEQKSATDKKGVRSKVVSPDQSVPVPVPIPAPDESPIVSPGCLFAAPPIGCTYVPGPNYVIGNCDMKLICSLPIQDTE